MTVWCIRAFILSHLIISLFAYIVRYVFLPFNCHVCIYYFHSYLALVAGLASEADYIFIPESPAPPNWPDKLCDKILQVLYLLWGRTHAHMLAHSHDRLVAQNTNQNRSHSTHPYSRMRTSVWARARNSYINSWIMSLLYGEWDIDVHLSARLQSNYSKLFAFCGGLLSCSRIAYRRLTHHQNFDMDFRRLQQTANEKTTIKTGKNVCAVSDRCLSTTAIRNSDRRTKRKRVADEVGN